MTPDLSHARPPCWLLVAALFICVLGAHANAQNAPEEDPRPDEFSLDFVTCEVAEVSFHNNAAKTSYLGHPPRLETSTVDCGAVSAGIEVLISGGAETLVVTPEVGWTAYPERVEAADGETVTLELRRGEWNGV
jgi:hypothetical protein